MDRTKTLLHALGEAIIERRAAASMSQQELAEAAGVHRSYMSDIERGLRNITLGSLEKIAGALKTTSADLLVAARDREERAGKSE
jgi:transcriptional regulator with XRE-family HTH domain